jgi:glucosyl-3-phosphoglycerate phosphatase
VAGLPADRPAGHRHVRTGTLSSRRLVLLRHGQTSWNATGRAQGHADVALDELGHRQAAAAAAFLASLEPAAIWTSDLARARQTSRYLEDATGLSAKADDRLREFDVGERQGMTLPEFEQRFPQAYDAWLRGDDMVRVPGSESVDDVAGRMLPALRECLDSLRPEETGVVVTHGACLKVALVGLLGWPQELAPSLRGVQNCGWAVVGELEVGGRLRLEAYNQCAGPSGEGAREL